MRELKWIDTLLNGFCAGSLEDDAIQICIKHMHKNKRKLYKYYDLRSEYTMPNLRQFANYYNDPTMFNDPFDCNIGLSLDQLCTQFLPVVLQQLYPTWNNRMIAVTTALLAGNFRAEVSDDGEEIIFEELRRIPQFEEMIDNELCGESVKDSDIVKLLYQNPSVLIKLLMYSTELPFKLSEEEASQLLAISASFINQIQEKGNIGEATILNKTQELFEKDHSILERLVESAKLFGVDIDEKLLDQIYNQCNTKIAELHKAIGKLVGITCFAQRWDNILMWSHYANKHTGLCVEYDFDIPFDTVPNSLLLPVRYTPERPLLPIEKSWLVSEGSLSDRQNNSASVFTALLKSLITKSAIWNHEQEWRHIVFVENKGSRLVSLPIVSKIIMGVNIAEEDRKNLVAFSNEHKIPLYQTQLREDRYEMIRKKIN